MSCLLGATDHIRCFGRIDRIGSIDYIGSIDHIGCIGSSNYIGCTGSIDYSDYISMPTFATDYTGLMERRRRGPRGTGNSLKGLIGKQTSRHCLLVKH